MTDVLIAGGGIVGAACAWELAKAGLSVALVEQSLPGGGATAAGMGHLVVLDDNGPELALSKLSVALWNELSEQLPTPAEFWNCGTLWVAADDLEFQGAREKLAVYQANDLPAELLDAQQLYEAEPWLRPGLTGGLRAMGDGVVYAPVVTRWLIQQAGVTPISGAITSFTKTGVQLADGRHVQAGAIIAALGAGTSKLLPELPVRPRKGHLAITDRYPGRVKHQVIELGYLQSAHGESNESVAFNVQPRPTGQLLIGSSRQYDVETSQIDPPILSRMLHRAFHYMPALAECSIVRTWTGFRASTPDKLPLIGQYRDNLDLATGHEGLGVTTSLGTAKLLTALLTNQSPPIPAAPYSPERFHA